jgi:alanyl-tRNA synthetase
MRELVNAGMERARGVCAAFTGSDEEGYRYIIGSKTVDLRAQAKAINAAISGKGGGRSTMIQGSCTASEAEIRAFFESFLPES